jgi:hypothetical protein
LEIKFLLAVNPTTGQPDYSQQWIEYYRSIGQNDVADQIMQQLKDVTKLFLITHRFEIHGFLTQSIQTMSNLSL